MAENRETLLLIGELQGTVASLAANQEANRKAFEEELKGLRKHAHGLKDDLSHIGGFQQVMNNKIDSLVEAMKAHDERNESRSSDLDESFKKGLTRVEGKATSAEKTAQGAHKRLDKWRNWVIGGVVSMKATAGGLIWFFTNVGEK